jgi:hypothetical protein
MQSDEMFSGASYPDDGPRLISGQRLCDQKNWTGAATLDFQTVPGIAITIISVKQLHEIHHHTAGQNDQRKLRRRDVKVTPKIAPVT